ncbi:MULTISPECIES: hypothetical protein [Streptomyces]|uniref:Helix-turn-helix domain-containing protein n=1 Tax=Streptomyces canarius TaxID=285453 RepID=A0ABQ3CG07_9ACTN|nr:hypothetical protein [Streptomyces canarius]GHA08632.1 hypothetical protein GCM10010345_11230 [Streptomyces canarius]
MSVDEQDERKEGAVPNSFGNALAWRWTREMPRSLKGGFLTMLYALRAMAAPSGELRFKDGKPIRIQDLARAAGCREHDARRYLDAGIRAGVVLVIGQRRRGTPTRYAIPNGTTPWPDWKAAEDYLKATARRRAQDEGPEGGSGHSGTNQFGPQRQELAAADEESVRSTEARMGSDHSGTTGSGHGGPNNPGSSHGASQEVADVVPQPQVVGGSSAQSEQSANQDDDQGGQPLDRCEVCGVPLVRPGKRCSTHRETRARRKPRDGRSKPVQAPLLMPVPRTPDEPHQAAPAPFQAPQPDPLAPLRTCGCGRDFRDRDPAARCPDCLYAEHAEATRLRRFGA